MLHRSGIHIRLGLIGVSLAIAPLLIDRPAAAQTIPNATSQPAALPKGWQQVDQRMVFLTVELSTTETTIAAVNKALKVNGYRKATLEEAAENARKEHARLDRQGGGPVSWQEFYGKTAQSFFYHPGNNEVAITTGVPTVPRPPQFDYIYRANDEAREKAEQDATSIGNRIDDLLARRSALEAQQSALWFKIAARGVFTLEIDARPLYRFELATGPGATREQVEAIRAGGEFLRALSSAVDHATKSIDNNQKQCLEELEQATTTTRTQLQSKLRSRAVADDLQNPKTAIGAFSLCSRRLQDSAQNMADAYELAIESDSRGDPVAKQSYRGQLQQMIFDYDTTLASTDQFLSRTAREWKVVANTAKPLSAVASATKTEHPSGEKTPDQLNAAKAQYQQDLSALKRALVGTIESRLNAAADAGDLATVEALQGAKAQAARDGSVPDGVKDSEILKAQEQAARSRADAAAKLAEAYKQAIRDYTKARDISEAQAVRDEFNASGLSGPTAEAGVSESPEKSVATAGDASAVVKLTARLPAYLTCRGSLNVTKDGILVPEGTYVLSKEANFLQRDFVLDLWMTVDLKFPPTFIGLGTGLDANGGPSQALSLLVATNGALEVVGDTFHAEHIGQETEAGDYMVRIAKSGPAVTFSIGVEKDGQFAPDFSRAFPDLAGTCPYFNDHNVHLFFRGGFYRKIRLSGAGGKEPARSEGRADSAGVANSRQESASPVHPARASAAIIRLTSRLPAFLESRGPVSIVKEGLLLPDHTFVATKEANFLKRDFVLDLWMTVDPKKPSSFIGLGTGQDAIDANPAQSLSLLVSNGGLQVVGYTFNAENIGRETEPGQYIVRIEKSGPAVTFSIGVEKDGQFEPDFSRAFPDIAQTCPGFNDHNVRLFFRGGVFKQIRLTTAALSKPGS